MERKSHHTTAAAERVEERVPIAGLEIVKVVRDFSPIFAGGEMGIGDIIAEQIARAAFNDEEIQTVSFHIEREQWQEMAKVIQAKSPQPHWNGE